MRLGRTLVTSQEALQRFAERLNAAQSEVGVVETPRGLDQAERELDRHGL